MPTNDPSSATFPFTIGIEEEYQINFERCLTAMLRHKPMAVLNPDPERIRNEFWQGEPSYARLFALFHQHHAERIGRPRWGDQLASVEQYADPIFAAYPDAKMIHMIRDPRDRYEASIRGVADSRMKAGGATTRWLYSVRLAQRNQRRYPDRYKIVRYESLVAEREATLREVCAFLNEAFVPTMLTLEGAIRFGDIDDDQDLEMAGSGTTEVEAHAVDDRNTSKRERAFIQAYAKLEMVAYGYQPEAIRFSFSDWLLFAVIDWPANRATMVTSRILNR